MIKYLKFFKIWKIAICLCFLLAAITMPFTNGIEYGFANTIISFAICIVFAIGPLIPDILYLKTPAVDLWHKWTDVSGNTAEIRKWRASVGELTSINIDIELKYGTFAGMRGGQYRTTLHKCTCPDFKKRKVPCKHMYYLAWKCGLEKL